MSNRKTPNFAYGNSATQKDLICVKEELNSQEEMIGRWTEKRDKNMIAKDVVFELIDEMMPFGSYHYRTCILSKKDIDKLKKRIKEW